ncbi:SHOCT domain-containing protein [Actinomycetes bacterium KLBMP 9797]
MVIDDEQGLEVASLPGLPGHAVEPTPVVVLEGSYRIRPNQAEAPPPTAEPGLIWSAVGQPITGIGAGRYRMDATTLYFERGMLSTNAQQVPLVHVVDVDMRQSMAQKARGVGNVVVHVQRQNGIELVILHDLPDPRGAVGVINKTVATARIVEQQRANTHHYNGQPPHMLQTAPTPSNPAPSPDPIEQLRRLGELRDAGILTEDEFLAKKADILARL